jgi:predicted N-acetyltransferase YhbS
LIRLANAADIPALEKLIPESVRSLSSDYYSIVQIESALLNVFGVDTQLIRDGTYFVAEADGQIVGCGGWSRRKTLFGSDRAKATTEDSLLDPGTDPARIRAFFVHPDWARRGIGGRLIKACEEAARAAGFQAIEMVATLPGEPLYTAFGYRVTERFDIPLPGEMGLPAALMRKEL